MNNMIPFDFQGNQIRVAVNENGDVLFSARDVALALGYANPAEAYRDHCKSLIRLSYSETLDLGIQPSNPQGDVFIKEPDLYRLVMKSALPSAQDFEKLVMEEILPSIRKTGSYSVAPTQQKEFDPLDMFQVLLDEAKVARAERIAAKVEQERLQKNDEILTTAITKATSLITTVQEKSTEAQNKIDYHERILSHRDPAKKFNATHIANRIGSVSAFKVNRTLEEMGFQVNLKDANGKSDGWMITDAGKPYGRASNPLYTSTGNQVKQTVIWSETVIDQINVHLGVFA